jgi:hypothetical protein
MSHASHRNLGSVAASSGYAGPVLAGNDKGSMQLAAYVKAWYELTKMPKTLKINPVLTWAEMTQHGP